MRRNMKKKGALELSVNSIVIMVIAFVVLGLILTFTRTIFKFGTEKTTGIFEATSLEKEPDSQNPITLSDTVSIKAKGKKTLNIGYYNKNSFSALNAKFGIHNCQNDEGKTIEDIANEKGTDILKLMPSITSASQTVGTATAMGYKIIITEKGLTSGTYICTVVVYNGDINDPTDTGDIGNYLNDRTEETNVYETKQIFLQIAT